MATSLGTNAVVVMKIYCTFCPQDVQRSIKETCSLPFCSQFRQNRLDASTATGGFMEFYIRRKIIVSVGKTDTLIGPYPFRKICEHV